MLFVCFLMATTQQKWNSKDKGLKAGNVVNKQKRLNKNLLCGTEVTVRLSL